MNDEKNIVVDLKDISKSFGSNKVLDNVNFSLHEGEVHALLGENGAGKTTLMNILYGLYEPTSGSITVKGKTFDQMTPKLAIQTGIGMVHQHFMLIEPFTVYQNIVLGKEITGKGGILDNEKSIEAVRELSQKYGLMIDPEVKVADISVGMQQRVEILKCLYRGADILIFDEPTAVLTPQEIDDFIKIVKNLTELGKSIIIITHKLSEIKAMADYCTVIRRGKFIDKLNVKEIDENILAEKMVGRDVRFNVEKQDQEPGEVVLDIKDLVVKDSRNIDVVKNLNLQVRRGEIVGVAGVDGNGQSELIEAITGLRKIESGKVTLKGKDITNHSPREIIDSGMNTIPEDRQKHGLILDYSIADNLILENVKKKPFSKGLKLDFNAINDNAKELIEKFDIRPNDYNQKTKNLSGGNQQKVIIAREISNNPDLLIAAQPTRGLDVGAIEFIHKYLVDQRNKNKAVLLVSFELDEIMDLSDNIAVIFDGKIVGEKSSKETNELELGRLMAGGIVDEQ
ncbi:MAG: ABC transporter ATP-binding protein [Finegoldia magna]|uniref:ABC transporter ATP-binding protein n=1 Tax=Finegoldia TaxID=150022 RepID=UPI00291145C6|nr:ABC transporter ATP-binding protein [Finegoldia magna]MDU4571392.1 ABC transporter ATP-binding protein [Finegoldia magna]MDU7478460.1 ABC transporter ATP-binding protein [Finegoldia magna]